MNIPEEGAKPINIALITHADASDRRTLSGTPYQIYYILNQHCGQVTRIDKLIPENMTLPYITANWAREHTYLLLIEYIKNLFWRLLGKRYDWRISLNAARFCARKIEKKLQETRYDLIWVEKSSISMPYVTTDIPIIYESDATFHALLDYYPWFTGLSGSAVRNGETLEQRSLAKASAIVLTADWARDSAITDYRIAPEKITVLPSPPNCDHVPPRDMVLRDKPSERCTFLFIGVEWERKGGEIAVSVVDELNRLGIPSQLQICGCHPPLRHKDNQHLRFIGFLNKNVESDMKKWERLFLDAHFFILPTRAECMGISFSEAAGFGLPVISTNTGGVPTVVKHGRTGLLFGIDESSSAIAVSIKNLWQDKVRYQNMRLESRRFFDKEISSESWIASVQKIIGKLIAPKDGTPSAPARSSILPQS